jgi:hypothetical protein
VASSTGKENSTLRAVGRKDRTTMKTKMIEVRDRMTMIPLLCVDMNPENASQRYLLRRAGYPCDRQPFIAVTHAHGGDPFCYDPYQWKDRRTYTVAHTFIQQNWEKLSDGDVVDVEFILGETKEPKISESLTYI